MACDKDAQFHSNKLQHKQQEAAIAAATVGPGAVAMVDDSKIIPFTVNTILNILDTYNDDNGDFESFEAIDAAIREYEETSGISLGIV